MAITQVQVPLHSKLLRDAARALRPAGLSVTDVLRIVVARIAAEQAIPFELRVPNAQTVQAMKDVRRGLVTAHPTVADLLVDLHAGP